ncbi:MAG: vWA domain-containing protein [Bacteroidota bacterium]
MKGKRYRIIVQGTYSMWNTIDSSGIDGAYIYKAPQDELDKLRWPPERITFNSNTFDVCVLPKWVGDTTTYLQKEFDTLQPLICSYNFNKWTGFRIDGNPLPNSGYNSSHIYTLNIEGADKPLALEIIDSLIDYLKEDKGPRAYYSNNSGEIKVTVEELSSTTIDVCGNPTTLLDSNKKIIGFKFGAAVVEINVNNGAVKKNLLKEFTATKSDEHKGPLGINVNGRFYCPYSIDCTAPGKNFGVGLIIDRSGSMGENFDSTKGSIKNRIEAAQIACNSFIGKMTKGDNAFLMTFSDDVTIDRNWTGDTTQLKNAVNAIYDKSKVLRGQTAYCEAVIKAIEKMKEINKQNKAIIVLTDGYNNLYRDSSNYEKLLNIISSPTYGRLKIYTIGLGLSNKKVITDPSLTELERLEIRQKDSLRWVSDKSRGKYYDASNAKAIDSIYNEIKIEISDDECCTIKVDFQQDSSKTSEDTITIFYPMGDSILTKVIIVKRLEIDKKDKEKGLMNSTSPIIIQKPIFVSGYDIASISYELKNSAFIKLYVLDASGKKVMNTQEFNQIPGIYSSNIELKGLKPGVYDIAIEANGNIIRKKIFKKK